MLTLAAWVPSSFSKYTRSPAVSTIAAAIVQLFLRASASAAAAAFLALSALIDMPYGFGICPNALAAHNVSTPAPARLQTDRRDMAAPPSCVLWRAHPITSRSETSEKAPAMSMTRQSDRKSVV